MKALRLLALSLVLVFFAGIFTQLSAYPIGVTLSTDKDVTNLAAGDLVTFTAGIAPEAVISGYTIDIWYDASELAFVSSRQLLTYNNHPLPYTLDPAHTGWPDQGIGSGLATSEQGRASVLLPFGVDPAGDLFSLSFSILASLDDGLDLRLGMLSSDADDINPPIGGTPFSIHPATMYASVSQVVDDELPANPTPEPSTLLFIGISMAAFGGYGRKRIAR